MGVNGPAAARCSEFRIMLEARRHQLSSELDRLVARMRDRGSKARLEDEPAEADMSDLDTSLVDITSAMLRRVDVALQHLDQGTYGLCSRCGNPIAEARLRAMPFAVRCRPCEAAREGKSSSRSALRSRRWAEGPDPVNESCAAEM